MLKINVYSFGVLECKFYQGPFEGLGDEYVENYSFRIMAGFDRTICEASSLHILSLSEKNEHLKVSSNSAFDLPKEDKQKFHQPITDEILSLLAELLQIHLAHTRAQVHDITMMEIAQKEGVGHGIILPVEPIYILKERLSDNLLVDVIPG